MGGVFICYRRIDSSDITGRLYDRLVAKLGRPRVFKDVFSIELGHEFDDVIGTALAETDVLLVVMGDRWDAERLHVANDPVRREIEIALANGVRIIPVFVRGARMPAANSLPPSIDRLAFCNGMPLRDDPDFDNDVERLLRGIARPWWRRRAVVVIPVAVGALAAIGFAISNIPGPSRPDAPPPSDVATEVRVDPGPPRSPPVGMVWIPPAVATIGSTEDEIRSLSDRCTELANAGVCEHIARNGVLRRELPRRTASVNGFFLDRAEVTVQPFADWLTDHSASLDGHAIRIGGVVVAEGGEHSVVELAGSRWTPRRGLAELPVISVTWDGAMRYCAARNATLPTGLQWERAARGPAGKRFPWGDETPGCSDAVLAGEKSGCPAWKVMQREGTGTRDQTQEGIIDLAGNVAEWVKDAGALATEHEVRGGSYRVPWLQARSAARMFRADSASDVGFRCASSAGGDR